MKVSEIKEAALKAQDLCCNGDTCNHSGGGTFPNFSF